MDYSLLVGIHDSVKGNSRNIRDNTLAVFDPKAGRIGTGPRSKASMKEALATSDPVQLGPSSAHLPEMPPPERTFCYFYQDFGGFAATDELNLPRQEIYYIGIIDIFTKYNTTKKLEHFFKSFGNDPTKISAVHPNLYGYRFLNFMKSCIHGNSTVKSPAH
jgi:1-phosphatidylinositol-4-phosphate 5-kinase